MNLRSGSGLRSWASKILFLLAVKVITFSEHVDDR